MKHETTTLNGADVRFYQRDTTRWYVLADVAGAIGVSAKGIKKQTLDSQVCVRPVCGCHGMRDMLHITFEGMQDWSLRGTGRLVAEKILVRDWLFSFPHGEHYKRVNASYRAACGHKPFADPSTIAPTMPLEKSTSEAPEVQTIEWRQFWSDEHNGISLRAMVEAGLYVQMSHAVRALNESGLVFCPIEDKNTGGRPSKDYILTLNNAQRFCARANTPTGRKILDVMIEHHNEYQALLNGDMNAANRLATQIRRAPQGALMTKQAELFLQMCQEQDAMRAQLEELKRRQDELEAGRETPKATNEYLPSQIARRAGWQTVNGRDHGGAVNAIADIEGAVEGVDYRQYRMRNPNSNRGGEYMSRLYSEEWVQQFEQSIREMYQQGVNQFTIEREGHPKINVYCTQYVRQFVQ